MPSNYGPNEEFLPHPKYKFPERLFETYGDGHKNPIPQQDELPLVWSTTPFTVMVRCRERDYEVVTVDTNELAVKIMDGIASLMEVMTGIENLRKIDGFWYGVLPLPKSSDPDAKTHTLWQAYLIQKSVKDGK